MTVQKSSWDVKFLSVVYINWGMFSVFVYHALTYYMNNEHEKMNFYFSV